MWKKPVGEEEDGKEERGNRKGRESADGATEFRVCGGDRALSWRNVFFAT